MLNEFQFLKGSIKRKANYSLCLKKKHFNSLKVRLKEVAFVCTMKIISDFNSLKVRLKVRYKQQIFNQGKKFQFLKGSIKSFY